MASSFVEALQKQAYTEYLLDILLAGTVEDKAALVKGQGKEVMQIGERVSGFAARYRAGCVGRGGYCLTGTDCR